MARKKKAGKPSSPYCTFPSLHSDVSALLEEDDLYFGFRDGDDPEGCLKHYDTKIMGRFVCHNDACSCKGWGSQKIAITIRMSAQAFSFSPFHSTSLSSLGYSGMAVIHAFAAVL